jgi:hypothetical protein
MCEKDEYIKQLEQALSDALWCLEDIAHGRWGWAWELIISEGRELMDKHEK